MEDHHRRDDALMAQFVTTLREQSVKLGELTAQCHSMEVQLASLTAIQKGEVEAVKYRLGELEEWRTGVNRWLVGIITTIAGAIAIFLIQALLRSGVK